jgi:hypothetical protein
VRIIYRMESRISRRHTAGRPPFGEPLLTGGRRGSTIANWASVRSEGYAVREQERVVRGVAPASKDTPQHPGELYEIKMISDTFLESLS